MQGGASISFEDLKPENATVTMTWNKLAVPFRIARRTTRGRASCPTSGARCAASNNISGDRLNEAAQYCLEKKIALPEALKWADLSIQAEERFENLATKADVLKAMGKTDEAGKVWQHAMELAKPVQLYTYARGLQAQKRDAEAMEIFKTVAQQSPQDLFGHMAQARIKSHAGDYPGRRKKNESHRRHSRRRPERSAQGRPR